MAHTVPGAIRVIALLAVALLVLAGTPQSSAEAATTRVWNEAEERFVDQLNAERAQRGLGRLELNYQLTRVGRAWSARMARDERLSHNPNLSTDVSGPWRRLGENVGRSSLTGATDSQLVDRLHRAFMDSSGHRSNILGAWNQVGVGVEMPRPGTMYVTVIFLDGPMGAFPVFSDVSGSVHEPGVARVWFRGIAQPCSRTQFCHTRQVRRGEMAVLLVNALPDLEPAPGTRFSDVPAGTAEAGAIAALADAGITEGCGGDRFCPDRILSRGEAATFMVRAIDALAPVEGSSRFRDVPDWIVHTPAINALERAGITNGCTADRYCPQRELTRGEVATLLRRTFKY